MIDLLSIRKSTNPKKKMMAEFNANGNKKTIHFGSASNKDFTIYSKGDPVKAIKMKNAYLARHKVNENWNTPLTAGSLSRWILWNKPTISASISDFKRRFSL
jgi:hypothetical protein